jgi:hypothetical protein
MCRDSKRGPRPRCSLMTINTSMSLAMILSFAQLECYDAIIRAPAGINNKFR